MDISIADMMKMQNSLYELHAHEWSPLEPEYGKDSVLFMVEEIGEVISILKKKGDCSVIEDPVVRAAFLEEMADVLMYYTDILLRYHVTAEEIADAYLKKHCRNMGRDFTGEYKEKYHG